MIKWAQYHFWAKTSQKIGWALFVLIQNENELKFVLPNFFSYLGRNNMYPFF